MSIVSKYTIFGIIFGTAFPLVGVAFDYGLARNGESYWAILVNNPIHFIVHLAPFVLGITFHIMGRKAQRIWDQLQALIEADDHIRYTAYHDSLTGLENRLAFTEKMAEELELIRRCGRETAVILFDIDKFKFINDTLGHNTGDELIKEIVGRANAIRPKETHLYRLGGDEFVGLWPNPPDAKALLQTVNRLVDACAEPFTLTEATVSVGISVGVSWLSKDDAAETQALGRADLALYHAKNSHGGTYAVFDPAMAEGAADRLKLQSELKQALSDDQLYLTYQPIMNVGDMSVAGFEALIRWKHPVCGEIMPDSFINAAEQCGLIVPIGRFVFHRACEEAKSWPDDISISVNLSPVQFKDRTLVEAVSGALRETGLPARRLIIEITESVFQIDPVLVQETLASLRRLGVRIALDDFGAGFSGINHLRQFAIDILKIDRQYTQALVSSDRERMLVRTIVALACALDLQITFEGVETHEQLRAASAMGGSFFQGYYASRPLPLERTPDFIASNQQRTVPAAVAG